MPAERQTEAGAEQKVDRIAALKKALEDKLPQCKEDAARITGAQRTLIAKILPAGMLNAIGDFDWRQNELGAGGRAIKGAMPEFDGTVVLQQLTTDEIAEMLLNDGSAEKPKPNATMETGLQAKAETLQETPAVKPPEVKKPDASEIAAAILRDRNKPKK